LGDRKWKNKLSTIKALPPIPERNKHHALKRIWYKENVKTLGETNFFGTLQLLKIVHPSYS